MQRKIQWITIVSLICILFTLMYFRGGFQITQVQVKGSFFVDAKEIEASIIRGKNTIFFPNASQWISFWNQLEVIEDIYYQRKGLHLIEVWVKEKNILAYVQRQQDQFIYLDEKMNLLQGKKNKVTQVIPEIVTKTFPISISYSDVFEYLRILKKDKTHFFESISQIEFLDYKNISILLRDSSQKYILSLESPLEDWLKIEYLSHNKGLSGTILLREDFIVKK